MNQLATYSFGVNSIFGKVNPVRSGSTFLVLGMLLFFNIPLNAQTPKDVTIPVTATVSVSPASIVLNWPNPAAAGILVLRRTKGNPPNSWIALLNSTSSTLTSLTDNNVSIGQTYEYLVQRSTPTLTSFGYAHAAIQAPVVDSRGKLLVVIDSTNADALGVELKLLKDDMRGDGWEIIAHKIGPAATVQSVKNKIIEQYNLDPTNLKAVLLIGRVPVPYAGNTAWDGHSDHVGAWPSDNYYSDMNGVWTDNSVNNTTGSRQATWNVPGDGKFDQSYMPSEAELQVGRIDFRRLTAGTFGLSEVELLRRYLIKDHKWRTKQYVVDNKALVDDNFGFFNGEAFAENGFRNAHPFMAPSAIVEGDFFNDTDNQSFLLGYGCGGGWYQGAGGVGSSTNFGVDSINIVFSNLFGSYFGDWDHETDPFMPSALASKGGILTCSWQGRPHWFQHAFASGETIGYCTKETQNAQYNNGFVGTYGESGSHVALLGDPTLRAHVIAPPSAITLSQNCTSVQVAWTASATAGLSGYHVYRAFDVNGPYTRITSSLVNGTSYSDPNPVADTLYYQVRAIKLESTPGGGTYLNNSVGPIKSLVITSVTAPQLTTQASGQIGCSGGPVTLSVTSNLPITGDFTWTGPFNFQASGNEVSTLNAGIYGVTASAANGCSATQILVVTADQQVPSAAATGGVITCTQPSVALSVTTNATNPAYQWAGPGGFAATQAGPITQSGGSYTVTVTGSNGCTATSVAQVSVDTILPTLAFPNNLNINCTSPCVTFTVPAILIQFSFTLNGQPVVAGQTVNLCAPGTQLFQITQNSNGCSDEYPIQVNGDFVVPEVSITGEATLSCTLPSTVLTASSSTQGVTFAWSGPGGTPSGASLSTTQSGVYTVTATAMNGCTNTATFEVNADSSIPTSSAEGAALTCANPVAILQGNSSTPNITYQWTGPNNFTSSEQNPSVSQAGVYVLQVSASNGCFSTAQATVTLDQNLPVFSLEPLQILNCNLPCVPITPVFANPLPNFTYFPQTVCAPGQYTVQLTNTDNGCAFSVSAAVDQAPPLQVSYSNTIVACTTVQLTAIATSGTPPYQYLWSSGETSPTITSTFPAIGIGFTVTDAGGCTQSAVITTTIIPTPLAGNAVVTNASAPGMANGAIDLSVSGGIAPYTYTWSNGASTQDIGGLLAGTYTCIITDVNGCTNTITAVVEATVAVQDFEQFEHINLSPNPTSGHAILAFKLQQAQALGMAVYDLNGKLLFEQAMSWQTENRWEIDLREYPSGVYRVLVLLEDKVLSMPLVIQR